MADPLGLIGQGAGGLRAIPGALQRAGQGAAGAEAPGASFKDALMENIEQVNRLQQEANTAAEDLVSGKRNDLENVLLATEKADTAFRMLVSLRNKVQSAYEEIKQVRV